MVLKYAKVINTPISDPLSGIGLRLLKKSDITEFENCAKTYRNWSEGIVNAFKCKYTNGPTEGYNSKIKVLKRISFGLRNFIRFRTRIIHCSI